MAQDAVNAEVNLRGMIAIILAAVVSMPSPAATAEPTITGSVVVAKSGSAALILWDATSDVTAATSAQAPQAQTITHLETLALQILHDKSASLTHSQTLTVRVLYDKTGAVSPVYHSATFEGVEHVFDLTVPRPLLLKQYAKLEAEIAQAKIAAPMQLNMTGTLPPQ
jgi:hypothetical protein